MLQQYLPFTVLKPFYFNYIITFELGCNSTYRLRYWNLVFTTSAQPKIWRLQQCLPFTVLKLEVSLQFSQVSIGCNSAYRLRYWNNFY